MKQVITFKQVTTLTLNSYIYKCIKISLNSLAAGAFSSDDCAVQIDLNLAKLLHQKWKETIQVSSRILILCLQFLDINLQNKHDTFFLMGLILNLNAKLTWCLLSLAGETQAGSSVLSANARE